MGDKPLLLGRFSRDLKGEPLTKRVKKIRVTVNIRDYQYQQKLTNIDETFKWLGNVARLKYITYSRLRYRADELETVDCVDNKGNRLMPKLKIRKHLDEIKEGVFVVIRRKKHDADEKTFWELNAKTPSESFVSVTIIYDGKGSEVVMYGMHDHYREPIELKRKGRHMVAELKLPPHASYKFYFSGQGVSEVSRKYEIISAEGRDGEPRLMNRIRVVPNKKNKEREPSPWELLKGSNQPKPASSVKTVEIEESEEEEEEEVLWDMVISHPAVGSEFESLFLRDWREVQLNDVVPSPELRKEVKEVMRKHWVPLSQLFRAYSFLKEPVRHMDQSSFALMIGKLKIYEKTKKGGFSVSHVSQVFARVNVEEDYGSDEEQEGIDTKAGLKLVEDDNNPDNLFVRSEFLEALVRIAIIKWKKEPPQDSFAKLVEKYLLKSEAKTLGEIKAIRAEMATEEVQNAISPYLRSLFLQAFLPVAMLDEQNKHADNRKSDILTASISLEEYIAWLRNIQLIGPKGKLKRREAFKAYCMPLEPQFDGEKEDSEMQWAEYLEMLCRIAPIVCQAPTKPESIKKLCIMLVGKGGLMAHKRKIKLRKERI
eukprot:CAMPEP_0167818110 /NCGR_PEP_ID=MMETSP0112_2-20121227/4612_1 /TAXON_ID=91324 /ORGANISM="Lotharella globosa, Strain CCCM811" /LENGTH=596 /DNA_ID=CAMNT_0007718037 /DNA_START=300 /DNA_END=2090 /DNA_ORIENTATION=-